MTRRLALATVLILAACSEFQTPPDLVVVSANGDVSVPVWSYCWHDFESGLGSCGDGMYPHPDPTNVGRVDDRIEFLWTVAGWGFQSRIYDPGDSANGVDIAVVSEGPGFWELKPEGREGLQEVHVFGRGPEGDASFIFLVELG